MLLVELTINSVVNYISDQFLDLVNPYLPEVLTFDNPVMAMSTDHGGECRMNLGDMALTPSLFSGDWPPPMECDVVVSYTADTEANAVILFDGVAIRSSYAFDEVTYSFKRSGDDTVIADSTVYSDTLLGAVSSNDCIGRGSGLLISFTTSGESYQFELDDLFCQSYCHIIYKKDGTTYLRDMFCPNGSRSLNDTEFFFPVRYWNKEPVIVKEEDGEAGKPADVDEYTEIVYSRIMSATIYHDNTFIIERAVADMANIENRTRCAIVLPLNDYIPDPGEELIFTDDRQELPIDVKMYTRVIRYDLANGWVEVEGDCLITYNEHEGFETSASETFYVEPITGNDYRYRVKA